MRTAFVRRRKVALAAAVAAVVALITLVLWAGGWNLLREPLAHAIGARIDRRVAINGDLHVALSLAPRVQADDIVVGNAGWSTAGVDMLQARSLALRVADVCAVYFSSGSDCECSTHQRHAGQIAHRHSVYLAR